MTDDDARPKFTLLARQCHPMVWAAFVWLKTPPMIEGSVRTIDDLLDEWDQLIERVARAAQEVGADDPAAIWLAQAAKTASRWVARWRSAEPPAIEENDVAARLMEQYALKVQDIELALLT